MMPATDSEVTSMDDLHTLGVRKGGLNNVSSQLPPTSVPSSTPPIPITTRPIFTNEAEIEMKAVSMASNGCSSVPLSSPAEGSPAKPAVTSPSTCTSPTEPNPATSQLASASESLTCTGKSLVSVTESPPSMPTSPLSVFGSSDAETDFPAVLTFKGVSVTLENNSVWKQFHSCGTEMILTKQGRRMFPYCRYRLSGLEPAQLYSLVLSIVPSDRYKYRWNASKWEPNGVAEERTHGVTRAFSHHYSPSHGLTWMGGLVSFYKLKLTNNTYDQEGHIILQSMHRYIPQLHVIPVPEGTVLAGDSPVLMGPECMTFTFPQTEFMAVTTYQNFRITQLKINHNPFARGFREEGNNSRLNRIITVVQPVVTTEAQISDSKPDEHNEVTEEAVDLSTHTPIAPAAVTATRLVLKPIMSSGSNKNEPYISCIRGKHALGELVLVEDRPHVETEVEPQDFGGAPDEQQSFTATSTAITPRASNPGSPRMYRKRRKRINRRRVNSQGREWKTASASPTVLRSPSLTVAMQPELDDVEGLLFVSFSSKEALDDHVRDNLASTSPSTTPIVLKEEPVEVTPETDVEKVARFEAILLQDLSVFKHKQVIHPELQEVGLKLSSLDPTKSVDLQYLGVHLPLPPPYLPEQGNTSSPSDEGLHFISRTGKTSDMTKIKGWKNKFIKGNETSPNCDGSQKNLSAFCSNMLDEYLETEAQNISERAAAFCTNPEGSVAYQLPATSASYVKTLDSVLKQREAASKSSAGSNRPCPLSHKHLFQPSLAQLSPASQRGTQSIPSSTSSQPGAGLTALSDPDSNSANAVQQRLCTQQPVVYQRPVASQGQTYRPSVLPKFQSRLLEMENGARNKGLSRTHLTTDRLDVALSVIVTKETRPSQILKVPQYPVDKATGPECGQDFCTLGCMCASLDCQSRGPLHCRRPECMFGCSCFKRKITKQLTPVENEQQSRPVYSVINMEYAVQPRPGTHADTLWKRSIDDVDPEPVIVPRGAPPCLATAKSQEEDKDPVYKYLESMMTCARIRGFNSNPPPEVTIEPKIVDASTPNTSAKPESATTEDLPKMYYRTLLNHKTAEKASQGTTFSDREARKQIEIQSGCEWKKDRKKVLEALCRRLNQNNLPQRFFIRPYCIRLITKIIVRKPSGSLIKYRVHISQASEISSDDDEEGENSNEEKNANKDEGTDEEDEDYQSEEEPVLRYGVTPFLSGVLPAGKLRAAAKLVGCQTNGLIQVNGKSYNQARLLLGNIGALHPANRLAAYVTGRLNAPADVAQKPLKSDTSKKALGTLVIKAASTVVPPTIMARKTTELKMPVHLSQTDSSKEGSLTLPQLPHPTPIINLTQTFVAGQSADFPFQKNSTSSTVSLTVSPSLKTPSFLGQSGTYSFRICPPANEDARSQNPPTVILPGGFTLIQLPKQQTDGAAQQSESGNSNVAGDDGAAQSRAHWLGMGIAAKAKELLSSTFLEPTSDEKTPSEESDDPEGVSEDSESTDYSREAEEEVEEENVDVETVDALHGRAMDNVKEASRKAVRESSDGSDIQEPFVTNASKEQHRSRDDNIRLLNKRNNHTWVERLRRSELRGLFEKLEIVLQTSRKTSRAVVLSKARREIQSLSATSNYLEEQKRMLIHTKNVYMKELSRLTGKSKREISGKLTDYYEGQKLKEKTMKWSPFFSSLLQSRAALLQANNPQSKNEVMPLLQSNFLLGPLQDHPTAIAAQNSANQMPSSTPLPLPSAASSLAQANITAPPAQTQSVSNEPVAPAQVAAMPHPPASQEGASSTPSTPTSNSVKSALPPNRITLPLIRSKTGRIILPSSLKPICQNFFPIMVMTKGEDGKVNVQPADADSSYNSESGLLSSDQPSDSRPAAEENKTVQPSASESKPSGVKTPLAALALLNKTIVLVPEALKATVENTPTASCSNVGHVLENPAALQPHSSPPIVRRSRGRPRKNDKIPLSPVSPASENKAKVATSQSHGETSNLVEERPKEKMTLTKTQSGDNPEPVKRRGRPLKRKSSETTWVPLVIRRGHSPPKPEDGPVSTSRGGPKKTHLNMDRKSSRPLTRGALGKDFPSAKKRSWLDVEKDLEPEDESE